MKAIPGGMRLPSAPPAARDPRTIRVGYLVLLKYGSATEPIVKLSVPLGVENDKARMFCPQCGMEFSWDVMVCPTCDVDTVDRLPDQPEPTPDAELVPVLATGDAGVIAVAKSLLEAEEIDS